MNDIMIENERNRNGWRDNDREIKETQKEGKNRKIEKERERVERD